MRLAVNLEYIFPLVGGLEGLDELLRGRYGVVITVQITLDGGVLTTTNDPEKQVATYRRPLVQHQLSMSSCFLQLATRNLHKQLGSNSQ